MEKRGRQKGQRGAKVYKIGNSGLFQMNGSWEKYQEQWEYLQGLSDRSGARTEVIMEALALYQEFCEMRDHEDPN